MLQMLLYCPGKGIVADICQFEYIRTKLLLLPHKVLTYTFLFIPPPCAFDAFDCLSRADAVF